GLEDLPDHLVDLLRPGPPRIHLEHEILIAGALEPSSIVAEPGQGVGRQVENPALSGLGAPLLRGPNLHSTRLFVDPAPAELKELAQSRPGVVGQVDERVDTGVDVLGRVEQLLDLLRCEIPLTPGLLQRQARKVDLGIADRLLANPEPDDAL